MLIRPFQLSDQSGVIELWRRCELLRPWSNPAKDIARKMKVNPELFLVAEMAGKIVGSVMAGHEGHRGWINYLAVAPDHRRQGIARKMMAEAEKRLRAAGCPKINLQVRSANKAVVAFYEAIGFKVDEVISLGKRLEED